MVCFALQGAVVVPTINSMCLAAGPGLGGVSPTLRGKGLGAGNRASWWAGEKRVSLTPFMPLELEHLPLAAFHSSWGDLLRGRWRGLHGEAGGLSVSSSSLVAVLFFQ